MIKISLYDKLFHSPNWNSTINEGILDRFTDILKSGYILSRQKLGLLPRYPAPCKPDSVYLSVHPHGELYDMFPGKEIFKYNRKGYEMTIKGIFFILSKELIEDCDPKPGSYYGECIVPDQVELYKYLVGIGNAGFTVNSDLVVCFNLIRYFNGELKESELVSIIKERKLIYNIPDRTRALVGRLLNPNQNELHKIIYSDVDSFVTAGYYYDVVRILDSLKKDIPLYDCCGYLINPKDCLMDVQMMHDYIGSNLNIVKRDGFIDDMEALIDSLKEKYKSTK